jgi:hypothetical protein
MEKVISEYLSGLTLGEPQVYKNFAAIPLFHSADGSPHYVTLKQALEQGALTIIEVGQEGSVPELKVINKEDTAVLLLDGEELIGAKQNRVLNTTILLAAHTETVIPVSCTEHGRWAYRSSTFGDSDVIMASQVRRGKTRTVPDNLKTAGQYRSDQGEVWDNIASMSKKASVDSPTGAMRDVFESRTDELGDYLKAVELKPGQKGLAVCINGSVVGLDVVSLDSAYALLHAKLVKSYAMEAILEKKKDGEYAASADTARIFIDAAANSNGTRFKSVGLGWDHRFEAEYLVGSALEWDSQVIHVASFPIEASEKIDPMAGPGRRRAYRTRNARRTS